MSQLPYKFVNIKPTSARAVAKAIFDVAYQSRFISSIANTTFTFSWNICLALFFTRGMQHFDANGSWKLTATCRTTT